MVHFWDVFTLLENIFTCVECFSSDDLLLMNTPPPTSKKHPAVRALERHHSGHNPEAKVGVAHEDVDKMLTCSPAGVPGEVRVQFWVYWVRGERAAELWIGAVGIPTFGRCRWCLWTLLKERSKEVTFCYLRQTVGSVTDMPEQARQLVSKYERKIITKEPKVHNQRSQQIYSMVDGFPARAWDNWIKLSKSCWCGQFSCNTNSFYI